MEAIKTFFKSLLTDNFYWALFAIIIVVILIFFAIVASLSAKRAKAEKTKESFKKSSVANLTDEEILNISNNAANPEEVKEYLTTEANDARLKKTETNAIKKSSSKKAKKVEKVEKAEEEKSEQPKKKFTSTKKSAEPIEGKKKTKTTKQSVEVKPETATTVATKTTTKQARQPAPIKKEEKVTEQPKKAYVGKWKICQESDGYIAILTASNGGTLLKTEKYKSLSSVKSGIETIKKNVNGGNFAISIDKYGHYRFKLFNLSNRLICVSEDYSSKSKCESGIESVKRFAETAVVIHEENK